jgi:hypothetical protein
MRIPGVAEGNFLLPGVLPSPRNFFFGDSRSNSSQFNIDEIETNPFELLVHRIRTQAVIITQVVLDEKEIFADVWRS